MEDLLFQPLTRKTKAMREEIEKAIETIYSIENEEMNPDAIRVQMISIASLENALRAIEES